MEQLSLDSVAAQYQDEPLSAVEYPMGYHTDAHGLFVVSATVAGVGHIVVKNRFLFPAVNECREKVRAALAARPSTMF